MENLIQTYRMRLDMTPTAFVRSLHDSINWKNRLIGIIGQKGVGKSTMILQHIKLFDNVEESLYVQADDSVFDCISLAEAVGKGAYFAYAVIQHFAQFAPVGKFHIFFAEIQFQFHQGSHIQQ